MKQIFLIGFMGSGKTTTAIKLSKALQTKYVDIDHVIEKLQGKSIPAIFSEEGEQAFRKYESEALRMIGDNRIISTGGGIVEREENIRFMRDKGVIIYLRTSLDIISARLEHDQSRPLWNMNERTSLYEKRDSLYESCADYTIDCKDRSVSSIVEQIISIMRYKGILTGE